MLRHVLSTLILPIIGHFFFYRFGLKPNINEPNKAFVAVSLK